MTSPKVFSFVARSLRLFLGGSAGVGGFLVSSPPGLAGLVRQNHNDVHSSGAAKAVERLNNESTGVSLVSIVAGKDKVGDAARR